MKLGKSGVIGILIIAFALAGSFRAQTTDDNVNFGYSRNPPAKKVKPRERVVSEPEVKPATTPEEVAEVVDQDQPDDQVNPNNTERPVENVKYQSVAKKTREIAKEEALRSLKPTEIYKVGVGDVLFISLQDSKSSYYTVLGDGAIDYPLGGGMVPVVGLTTTQIEELLRGKIQLFENPDVSVRVREHSSHAIDVLGLVGVPGKHYLQREAMPLYTVRAQAVTKTEADLVVIKRNGIDEMTFRAGTPEFDDTLIYPGDVVEFEQSTARASVSGFVYIGGLVRSGGRYAFAKGMTLTQAIFAAGGLSDEKVKTATIRRKNEKGFLVSESYKLTDIRKGKSVDPVLEEGDMIEVGD
ncbi:MAG: polysaccharide biosynthesis/export family protein [Pyrinomonadaceae bacterium]